MAAFANPWPGGVAFYRSPSDLRLYAARAHATTPAKIGTTQTAFYSGPASRWDRGNVLRVAMANGALASADDILVLGGANMAAIENADGEWEIIQFAQASLVAPGLYDLSRLLRGQAGTEGAMRDPVAAGARFVLLDAALRQVDMTAGEIGLPFNWKVGPAPYDIGNSSYSTRLALPFTGIGLRPLSPVQVRGQFSSGDDWRFAGCAAPGPAATAGSRRRFPLVRRVEAYEVDILNGGDVVRTIAANTPLATYTAAQQTADFGAPQPSYFIRICQLSPVLRAGPSQRGCHSMRTEQWNQIISLWHSGYSIEEISRRTGVPVQSLGQGLLGAAEREARVWQNCGVPKGTPVLYPETVKR